MAGNMFLYWGSGSPPCWRAMMTLEEKGLKGYKNKLLSFATNEHKSEEVLKINPRGQVPAFKHGDVVINESLAICDYLENTYSKQGTKLIPDEPAKKALVLQRKYEALNLHAKGVENYLFYFFRTKPEDQTQTEIADRAKSFREELGIWEGHLGEHGDKSYAAGQNFSMADIVLFPTLAFFWRTGLNMQRYPRLGSYFGRVRERPSAKASWPPHWKDSPNQDKLKDI